MRGHREPGASAPPVDGQTVGSSDLLDTLFAHSPVGIAQLDRELRFTRINASLTETNGLTAADHIGRTPMELLPGIAPDTYLQPLLDALDGHESLGVEVVGETAAQPGRRRVWEESFYPLVEGDAVVGVGVVAIEVTERREAEAAIREREATLGLILDSAPSAMLVVDEGGAITAANTEAERVFGYEPGELLGRPVEILVPAGVRGEHPSLRQRFHHDPRSRIMGHGRDLKAVRKDGTEFPVEVGLGATAGGPRLVTCVVTDITARTEAERERQELLAAEQAAREEAERARERLSHIQRITEAGLVQLPLDELLRELLERVLQAVGGDVASVLLVDDERTSLVATASVGLEEEVEANVRVPIGQGFNGRVAAAARPMVVAELDEVAVYSTVLAERGLHSMAGVPLLAHDEVIGVLNVASEVPDHFGPDDAELLQLVAHRAALAIERTRSFEQERSIAQTLQRSLLPDRLPTVPGVAMAARYLAGARGTQVGGDWYDVVTLADGSVAFVIGDVMGHGVRSASVMGQLRAALRIYLSMSMPLTEAFAELNRTVLARGEAELTTVVAVRLWPDTGRLEWVNAGHPPPAVRHPDGQATLLAGSGDCALGAAEDWAFTAHHATLQRCSTLLLYTDGLVERRGESLDAGFERLIATLAAGRTDPEDVCRQVVGDLVGDATSHDDVAVLAVQLLPPPEWRLTAHIPAGTRSLHDVRQQFTWWLAEVGAEADEIDELEVAVSEALSDASCMVEAVTTSTCDLAVSLEGSLVEVVVQGAGLRQAPEGTEHGRGLVLMEALVDELAINHGPTMLEVRLTRRLRRLG